MNKTSISWTDYTSNPIRARNIETGKAGHFCERVSPGCAHCYASEWNQNRYGTGVSFLPQNRGLLEHYLKGEELREWSKPKYADAKVFVCDMTDLFGEWVPDKWLYRCFEGMGAAPLVTFQILTKRPERAHDWITARAHDWITDIQGRGWPLANVWLGISAENQHWLDKRVPWLLDTPAAIRFVSYEPALGPLDLKPRPDLSLCVICGEGAMGHHNHKWGYRTRGLDWVICGAESGVKRRPFNVAWARAVRDQCRAVGVAFFFKQAGGRFPGTLSGDPELDSCKEFPR